MSQTFVSPTGEIIHFPSPVLAIDVSAAAVVWDEALCAQVDPELFFPTHGDTNAGNVRAAKRICGECPVQQLCLDTFGAAITDGIVGGLSERERRGMRADARRRRQGKAA
jgi:hypothetical protein